MWTAEIINKEIKDDGGLWVVIKYSNGKQTITKHENIYLTSIMPNYLNDLIKDQLNEFESVEKFANTISIGPYVPKDINTEINPSCCKKHKKNKKHKKQKKNKK